MHQSQDRRRDRVLVSQRPVVADVLQPLSPQNPSAATGRLTISLGERTKQAVREIAEEEELSISDVVRRALRMYIKNRTREKTT